MLGITLSYILGLKLGLPVLKKYGPKIRIKEHHIEKHIFYLKIWAISFNDWLFYTGRTSFNSIFCRGIKFDTLAFLFVRLRWCAHLDKCFIGLGWKLGEKWRFVEYSLHHYGIWILLISAVVTCFVWLYIKKRKTANSGF